METQKIKELLQRYQTGNLNQSEKELVENWYGQLIETGEWQWSEAEKELMQKMLEARIMNQVNSTQKSALPRIHSFSLNRWRAAAAVIFLLGGVSYFLFSNKTSSPKEIATKMQNDVKAPQTNRAMVTLANGEKIYLDSSGNGTLATQGNVKLVKLANGEIAYQREAEVTGQEIQYNTLFNPRGSKVINMTLADGSKVWLNAGSSLTYPVTFNSKERRVSITGEAYFEVAHDASKPFNVSKGSMEVQVLGTHFNINAYEDETEIKVTLLEGAVKVNKGNASGRLKPGQQARVTEEINVANDVNLDAVMAWKNGFFQFNKASLQDVLKQLVHWYDVDIIYQEKIQAREFAGEMERDLNLSQVLKLLEKNGVHFRIEGKKIIVMP